MGNLGAREEPYTLFMPRQEAWRSTGLEYDDKMWPLLADVKRSSRYAGCEYGRIPPKEGDAVRFCLAFPDVYEIGMSYLGFQGEASELDSLAQNMPLWGSGGYLFPSDDLKRLDVPIANLGPLGKDDHKNSERINLPYFLHVLPPLFRRFVELLAEEAGREGTP